MKPKETAIPQSEYTKSKKFVNNKIFTPD